MAIQSWRRIDDFRPRGGYPGPSVVVDPIWEWDRLNPRDREGALTELSDWINNVLIARYRLGDWLPRCWALHPEMLSVLVWLHETAPELSARNAALCDLDTDWEAELRGCAQGWLSHCQEHREGPIGNPPPVLAVAPAPHPRLLLLDHCLRVLDDTVTSPGAELDDATAAALEAVLARAGVMLGRLRGRRKAEVHIEISDLVLDLARETLAR
jgi:hypothetical protein